MRWIKLFSTILVVLFVFTCPSFALNYNYRQSEIDPTVELGFQHYEVATVTQDDSAFAEASLSLSSFYPEVVRLVNTSSYDASVKINSKGVFTVQAGSNMIFGFDNPTTIEIKSAETSQTTVVEVSVWGRTDLDM